MEMLKIDNLGRVQLPEKVREQLGLHNNSQLSLRVEEGKLILNPLAEEPELYYEGSVLVFRAPKIHDVETIIEDLRSERINEFLS